MHEYRHGQYKMHEHRSRRCSSRLVRCVRNPKSKASVIRPVPAENHLRPDARARRSRRPDLLLRLPLFALDTRFDADYWADDVRLSDIEPGFTCTACGKRGADVRPDFNRNRKPVKVMGFR